MSGDNMHFAPGSAAVKMAIKMLDGKASMHYIRRRRLAVAL